MGLKRRFDRCRTTKEKRFLLNCFAESVVMLWYEKEHCMELLNGDRPVDLIALDVFRELQEAYENYNEHHNTILALEEEL